MADPVSWLQIEQGWNVVTSDGVILGTVAQVEGDKQTDIFDGLAVESTQPRQIRYVPAEQVGAIYPGEVTLKIASADTGTLEPFQACGVKKFKSGRDGVLVIPVEPVQTARRADLC